MKKSAIFIVYNRKDRNDVDRLLRHLTAPRSRFFIKLWDDRRMEEGSNWVQHLDQTLDMARVAVLVLTPDFLASGFALNRDIPNLFKRRSQEGLTVMPLIARPCHWENIPWLQDMEIRPSGGVPIWNTGKIDEWLDEIAREIRNISDPRLPPENSVESINEPDDSSDAEEYGVPWFFQGHSEAARRAQVNWAAEKLGLDNHFFSELLNMEADEFREWRDMHNTLSPERQDVLSEFWYMILHLLSYLSFNTDLVQRMIFSKDERERRSIRLPYDPPWIGTSIKEYLEASGLSGISEVSRWALSFRFADRNQIDTQNKACP